MVALGRAIGGRLAAGSSPRRMVPTIMSATPATARMIGSAQEERRFTWPESSRHTDGSLERAHGARDRGAVVPHPPGSLTDFDGTLSPIVTDPVPLGSSMAPPARCRRSPDGWQSSRS